MLINLIDVDNKFPNLALMKLSAWWKNEGHNTILNFNGVGDENYLSCVFTKNREKARQEIERTNAIFGGSGLGNYHIRLWKDIEHVCPDYALYGIDYSMGFTSRGCQRRCDFCIVPAKEGNIVEWSPLSEFVKHRKVVVLDNNFLASPKWKEKLKEMTERNLKVDFNQGLDIRLLDEEKAELLTRLNPPYLRFVWDNIRSEISVRRGIKFLRDAGYPIERHRIGFYVLVGYDSTIEEDLYRCNTLHFLDINTHVQVYDGANRQIRDLARWANRPWLWKSCAFQDYLPGRG